MVIIVSMHHKAASVPFSMSALIMEPSTVPLTCVPWPLDWSPVSPHPLYEYSMIFLQEK